MAKTKGEVVTAALTEIGIADFEFDVTTQEGLDGVDRLDSMMSMWYAKGIDLAYNFDGAVGDGSGLPSSAFDAVIANLAIRLSSAYGKTVPMQVMAVAKAGIDVLFGESAKPTERQFGPLPSGAGHKITDNVHFILPEDRSSWEDTAYSDFAEAELSMRVGDIGTVIPIDLLATVDLTLATAVSIRYRKPDGTEEEWTGVVNSTAIEYTTTSADDVDQEGIWFLQAGFVLSSGVTGSYKTIAMRVDPVIDVD